MKENFNFVGKKSVLEKSKNNIIAYLQDAWQESASQKQENEIEKTSEDIETIEKAKKSLNNELASLGLTLRLDLQPEEVHIISRSTFLSPKKYPGGDYSAIDRNINVYKEEGKTITYINVLQKVLSQISGYSMELGVNNDLDLKHILIHESTHKTSHHKYALYREELNKTHLVEYRVGYEINSPKGDFMGGFNEAVVEATTLDIVNRENLSQGKKQIKSPTDYRVDVEIVDKIAEKIALLKKEKKEDVWKRFKTGQFTGNMMHLRDIEKAFGPGSLRILASMKPGSTREKPLYVSYFNTEDPSARQKISEKIIEFLDKEKKLLDYLYRFTSSQ